MRELADRYLPSKEDFDRLARSSPLVPVWREVMADRETPVGAFLKLGRGEGAFLLESVEGGEVWGRFSFLGVDPFLVLRGKAGETVWEGEPPAAATGAPDPLRSLAAAVRALSGPSPGLPSRLRAGAVGYVGYDAVRYLERLPEKAADDLGLPDVLAIFPSKLIVFDHLKQRAAVVGVVRGGSRKEGVEACEELLDLLGSSSQAYSPWLPEVPEDPGLPESSFPPGGLARAVAEAKEYVYSGDVFQVVLAQRFSRPVRADPFDVYRVLRLVNPSPYMFYLSFPGGIRLAGSSPEPLVRVEGREVLTRPIAGTRPRGRGEEEDRALEAELLADPKERAEHVMLVDLARNDLGRVCRPGSVRVSEFMTVERYSHVMHIVSTVRGELAPGLDAFDALMACFPAGTVSGAPKVRAMEIIEELEPVRRGPYAGAVGYADFSGNLDTCITIRTVVFAGGRAHVQAGAGIVADSVPEREEEETRNKARALLAALEAAEGAARGE